MKIEANNKWFTETTRSVVTLLLNKASKVSSTYLYLYWLLDNIYILNLYILLTVRDPYIIYILGIYLYFV